jgi:hypothetical protein
MDELMTQVNEFKKEIKADTKEWKAVSRLLWRCGSCYGGVEAALEVSRLLWRCGRCCGVSRPLSKC